MRPPTIIIPATKKVVAGLKNCQRKPPPIPATIAPSPTDAFSRPSAPPRVSSDESWDANDLWTPSVSAGKSPSMRKLNISTHVKLAL